MIYPIAGRRRATPVRFTLTSELGHPIDGAWWPHSDRIAGELPDLVAALAPRLGEIVGITVNWPPLQRPPDLNWQGWQARRQHVITFQSGQTHANLLIVPYATNSALAQMMLRRVINHPINAADQNTSPFRTAGLILCAAQQQCASAHPDLAAQVVSAPD